MVRYSVNTIVGEVLSIKDEEIWENQIEADANLSSIILNYKF